MNTAEAVTPKTLHDFTVKTIEGHDVPLKTFKNKVLLVVNVASKCGLTPQYADLEKLYKKYRAKGFEILAFPANNFGGQEPGTNEEIQNFCSTKYEVTFPIFSKISVLGADKHELYTFLTSDGQEISWNFEKFLIGKNGAILKRYSPRTAPTDEEIIRDIEAALK
ncbi:MAG TPA: glutathione peroxidase [Patescibacteria group bacterium]|nr:glutathione peroxidase [Patescibacteria group bacterium]